MARPKNTRLREFILQNLEAHPTDIATYAAKELGVTRASVNGYLRELIEEGLIEATGATRSRRYKTKRLQYHVTAVDLTKRAERDVLPQEDIIWRDQFAGIFKGLPENVLRICEYGFSEMVNNAIDHSEGTRCIIGASRYPDKITMTIADDGVGIFDKITKACRLADKHEAILELSKGKLTTDRSKHSGEGIFFTSRMFDTFSLISGGLGYARKNQSSGEVLIDVEQKESDKGTGVYLEIANDAKQTIDGTFDKYLDDQYRFSKTVIPLKLASYEGDHLVSRSQAKRIMSRVEKFSSVALDFDGVAEIGQQFADEIFRVWAGTHPQVSLIHYNASSEVERMIGHARANAEEDASQLSLNLESEFLKGSPSE